MYLLSIWIYSVNEVSDYFVKWINHSVVWLMQVICCVTSQSSFRLKMCLSIWIISILLHKYPLSTRLFSVRSVSIRIFGQVQQVKAFVGFSCNVFSTFLKHSDSHFCPLLLFTLILFLQIYFDSNKIKNETWFLWDFAQFEWSVHFLLKTQKKHIKD